MLSLIGGECGGAGRDHGAERGAVSWRGMWGRKGIFKREDNRACLLDEGSDELEPLKGEPMKEKGERIHCKGQVLAKMCGVR